MVGVNGVTVKGNILFGCGLTGVVVGVYPVVVVVKGGLRGVAICDAVRVVAGFEDSPSVSGCKGLKRACISGSARTCCLSSVFLFRNQLIIRRPFCCVVRGSTGLIGVRSLLNDLRGTVNRCGEVSVLRDKVLPTVRPLGLGEEFRDGGRFSKTDGGWSRNKILAGSGGVSSSTKMPTGVGGFAGSCSESGGSSKVSRRLVIKGEIFKVDPPSPNKTDASDGAFGSIVVADGSSKSRSRLKSDKSVGGSRRSRVFLRVGIEVSFSSPSTIRLRKDVGEEGVGD